MCKHDTRTRPFNGPLSEGPLNVWRQTNLDFTEARDSEWQWHQLGHMQVCTSLQTGSHAITPPLSFLQAGSPSCRPTNSVKALKAMCKHDVIYKNQKYTLTQTCSSSQFSAPGIRRGVNILSLITAYSLNRRKFALCDEKCLVSLGHPYIFSYKWCFNTPIYNFQWTNADDCEQLGLCRRVVSGVCSRWRAEWTVDQPVRRWSSSEDKACQTTSSSVRRIKLINSLKHRCTRGQLVRYLLSRLRFLSRHLFLTVAGELWSCWSLVLCFRPVC